MAKKIIKNDPLSEKISQCSNFTWLICIGGIAIPMGLIWISCKEIKSSVAVVGLVITVLPTFLAFRALECYNHAKKELDISKSKRKENHGDWSLYIGGLLTILLMTLYVHLSGGIKDNLMAFYFIYIPSTTAVAFRTKKGLLCVSIASIVCLFVLYFFSYGQDEVAKLCRWWYLGFSVYQIILVVWLEFKTNRLSNN